MRETLEYPLKSLLRYLDKPRQFFSTVAVNRTCLFHHWIWGSQVASGSATPPFSAENDRVERGRGCLCQCFLSVHQYLHRLFSLFETVHAHV